MIMTKSKKPFIYLAFRTIYYSWKASPKTFLALVFSDILLGVVQLLQIVCLRTFFDTATLFARNETTLQMLVQQAIVFGCVMLIMPVMETMQDLSQGYFWRRGNGYMYSLFHKKVATMDYLSFEMSQTFDSMKKTELANDDAPAVSVAVVEILTYYLPFSIMTSLYLFSVKPLLVLALLLILCSIFISEMIRASAIFKFEDSTSGEKRKAEYLESCIMSSEYVRETRTLGAFDFFLKAFIKSIGKLNGESKKVEKRIASLEILLRVINTLGYGVIIGILVYYVYNGSISIGAIASIYYSIEKLNGILSRMVESFGEIMKSVATTSFLINFLDTPEIDKKTEALEKNEDIHLKEVSFSYPEIEKPTLNSVNLTIRHGETIAVVGENGAGKTTLVKCITGLLTPTDGSVHFGDKNIAEYAHASRFENISAVFQNYGRYKVSVADNIRISDLSCGDPVTEALEKAMVSCDSMENDPETILAREFGGIDVSGGQWQRIAIARGLYRQHQFIILDEPTSAIDALEESTLFHMFEEIAKGKTVIIATHRLGLAKIADRILVLDKGRIIEQGNHTELLARKGKYHSMYVDQAQWYDR
jgi:ATP-binding cassette subfamily B protein